MSITKLLVDESTDLNESTLLTSFNLVCGQARQEAVNLALVEVDVVIHVHLNDLETRISLSSGVDIVIHPRHALNRRHRDPPLTTHIEKTHPVLSKHVPRRFLIEPYKMSTG